MQIGRLPWQFALSRAKEWLSSNRILSGLAAADLALLEPHLQPVELSVHRALDGRNRRIDHVYFIEVGFASVVADGSSKPSIEVGIIDREEPINCGRPTSAANSLHRAMLHYAHAYLLQTTSTAVANARSKIEQRLARWLLMAHDRIDGDRLPLTHEFLSLMLGVRRSGVTTALQALERKGLISRNRANILVLDRKGLEKQANGTYVASEAWSLPNREPAQSYANPRSVRGTRTLCPLDLAGGCCRSSAQRSPHFV